MLTSCRTAGASSLPSGEDVVRVGGRAVCLLRVDSVKTSTDTREERVHGSCVTRDCSVSKFWFPLIPEWARVGSLSRHLDCWS